MNKISPLFIIFNIIISTTVILSPETIMKYKRIYRAFSRLLLIFALSLSICTVHLQAQNIQDSTQGGTTSVSQSSSKGENNKKSAKENANTEGENKESGGSGLGGLPTDCLSGMGPEGLTLIGVIIVIAALFFITATVVMGLYTGYRYFIEGENASKWGELGFGVTFYKDEVTVNRQGEDGRFIKKTYDTSGRFVEFHASFGIRDKGGGGIGLTATYGEMSINHYRGEDADPNYLEIPSAKYAMIGPEFRIMDSDSLNFYVNMLAGSADRKDVGLMGQFNTGLQFISPENRLFFRAGLSGLYTELRMEDKLIEDKGLNQDIDLAYELGVGYFF